MEVDREAEHIAKTPLAVIPALALKGEARGADRGPADPLVRPNHPRRPLGLPLDAAHRQEDLRQEG